MRSSPEAKGEASISPSAEGSSSASITVVGGDGEVVCRKHLEPCLAIS